MKVTKIISVLLAAISVSFLKINIFVSTASRIVDTKDITLSRYTKEKNVNAHIQGTAQQKSAKRFVAKSFLSNLSNNMNV